MPAWGVHLVTVNEILKRINIDEKNDFIFGNILPDILNGYLVKNPSNIVSHLVSHYNDRTKEKFISYKVFYDLYKDKLDNKVILGYLVHLMTDNLWNKDFYDKKVIYNNGEVARS